MVHAKARRDAAIRRARRLARGTGATVVVYELPQDRWGAMEINRFTHSTPAGAEARRLVLPSGAVRKLPEE
jgi:hypothetical protein